ncbi:pyridine nucleotide-disulfide oxidoreductase, partial [Streptomyces sp. BE230]|nr:pyridine nucleotide-disulfide oxidoreductase [Streptomyces sp. BE230]
LLSTSVTVPGGGPHWFTARLRHRPDSPEFVVLFVRACQGAALDVVHVRTDGVLAMCSRAEVDVAVDHDSPEEDGQLVLEWQALGLRRRIFVFRATPVTAALV